MEINGKNNSFITRKEHKEDFHNNPTVRLINPEKKPAMTPISMAILDKASKNIREAINLHQWRNTETIIDWFKGIRNKHLHMFVIFDIKEFYPSITEYLLEKALLLPKQTHFFQMMTKKLFATQKKSFLFNDQQTWIKRDSGLFDVTMRAYDGMEVCELAGNYLLYKKNYTGLHRDDGPAVFKNKGGPESEKIKTSIQSIFQENELKINIQCNLNFVDYLDVTFNLTDSYRPFNKTNNETNYIHNYNHNHNYIHNAHIRKILQELATLSLCYNVP